MKALRSGSAGPAGNNPKPGLTLRRSLRMVLLLLDALLVLLFVAGYAARYVHPRHLWWLQLIAIGLPYLSVLVLGATVGVGVGGPRKLLVFHLALCLLVAWRFLPTGRLSGATLPATEDGRALLKVMNFNVWPKHPTVENWRANNVMFLAEQPHVTALQEMPAWFSAIEFITPPPDQPMPPVDASQYRVTTSEVPPDCRSTQAILSRLPFEEQAQFPITTNADGCTPVVRVQLRWQGQEIALYSVHLRSFQDKPWRDFRAQWNDLDFWSDWLRGAKSDFLARAQEAEQLAALTRAEERPVIVCGDLNSTPHNWVYWHISKGWTDAFSTASGWRWGATYHARFRFARIDFILVSPEWRVASARVLEAGLSDHLPVVARLSLR